MNLRSKLSIFAFMALLLVLLVFLGMSKRLDHDENQFVAAGALLARRGLLPYRDYPYFHMPNLVFVDALLFRLSDHLLLAARALSIACGFGSAAIVLVVGRRLFRPFGSGAGWTAGILATVALVTQPLFASTSGRAWNHDLPVLLTLLAFLAALRSATCARPGKWQVCAGALIGVAVGTRLTFAPSTLALGLMIVAARPGGGGSGGGGEAILRRCAGLLRFGVAGIVALTPSIWLLAMAPRAFLFGNLVYPGLNTEYRQETGYASAMSATGKLLYVFTGVLSRPGSAALFVALMGTMLFVVYPRAGARRAPHPHRFAIASLLGLIACLLIGTFAPTPLFPVYFYAPLPFVILLILFASADPRGDRSVVARVHGRLVWLGVIAIGLGVVEMDQMGHPRELLSWVPLEVHRAGREVCRTCPRGRILTLSPIFALEGGAEIYEELATGPFAMRAGDRVREADEQNLKLMDEEDLPELFERRPPTAVLSGLEGSSDDALVAMAASREFVERRFTVGHRTLLLQARRPGDARVSNQPVIGSPSR